MIADGQGTAWALGVRDCSVQRRNQKIIEESASPVLGAEQTAELKASAERLARRGRLPRRLHRRVPLPPGRAAVRLPRGQHPAAGRAPDHRGHHRHSTWSRLQLRVAAASPLAGRPPGGAPATRSRPGSTPRTPTATSPLPRPHRPAGAADRPRHPGRHRRQRGRHHPRRLRLDDRQDHRLRPRPATRRWAGCAARWPRPP